MTSLHKQLEKYLKERWMFWVHKGELLKHEFVNPRNNRPYMADTVAGTLRKMQANSVIRVQDDQYKVSIEYKWMNEEERRTYIPKSDL